MSAVNGNEDTSSSNEGDEYEDARDELAPLPDLFSGQLLHGSAYRREPIQIETEQPSTSLQNVLLSPSRLSPSFKDSGQTSRRSRLNILRNRMISEFGSGSPISNTNNSLLEDETGSASESASLASWGRNLLMQPAFLNATPVYPADSVSTKAFSINHITNREAAVPVHVNSNSNRIITQQNQSSSRPPPPPLPKSVCPNVVAGVKLPPPNSTPPPIPPRKTTVKLPDALPSEKVSDLDSSKLSPAESPTTNGTDDDRRSSDLSNLKPLVMHQDSVPLMNSFARHRGHAKTNSLDRGLSLAKSMKTGPFPPPGNKSNSLKRECAAIESRDSSSYLSFDGGEEDLRNSDAQGVIRQITSSLLSEPLKEESDSPLRSPPCQRVEPPVEEKASTSSMSTSPSIIKQDAEGENGKKEETANAEALDKAYKLQIVIPKSAIDSKLDSDSSSHDITIDEPPDASSVDEIVVAKPPLTTEYSDPITRDVERRMSMKGIQQASKGTEGVASTSSAHSSGGLGRAAGIVKGYGSYATELFRGAFLRAKSAVTSNSAIKLPKEDEESCNDSEHDESLVAEGMAIVRPKSTKRGPFDFDGTRCFQELNNEHTGAVWCMKFSLCGRLLATAGQDNIIRVWVLRNYLSYFNALRDRYNLQSKKNTSMSLGESCMMQNPMQDIENDLRSSSTTLGDSAASSSSPDEETSVENTSLMAPKPLCAYRGHTADVLDLSWSRNYFILSSGMDRTVKLWHLSRPECLCCFQHMDFVTCIAFMPKDDRYFLSGSLDGKLRLWHIPDKKVALWNEVEQVKFITAIAFVKNGRFAVVGTYDGRCFFYTTDQLKYHTVIDVRSSRGKNARGHKVTGLAAHGDKLLVTSNDSRIRMYDLRDMALTCKFKGAQNERSQIRASFSPDGKHVICGSEDRFVYVWTTADLPSSLAVRKDRNDSWQRIRGHSACVTVAIFAPRPQLFLSLLDHRRSGEERGVDSSKNTKATTDRQIHGDVIISGDLSGSIRVFVNRTRIKAGASNFFAPMSRSEMLIEKPRTIT